MYATFPTARVLIEHGRGLCLAGRGDGQALHVPLGQLWQCIGRDGKCHRFLKARGTALVLRFKFAGRRRHAADPSPVRASPAAGRSHSNLPRFSLAKERR